MAHHRLGPACAVLLLCACNIAPAQVDLPRAVPEDYSESLFLDPLAFAGRKADESRIDVYLQVGYDNLSFVKREDKYQASFEVTITVNDSAGTLVGEKSWTEDVKGLSFDESVTPTAYALVVRSFSQRAGRYMITGMIRDLESRAVKKTSRICFVPDFAKTPVAMSDIMLVSRITYKGVKKSILPNVSPNLGNIAEAFYAFAELYNRAAADSMRIEARAYDNKGVIRLAVDTVQYVTVGVNEVIVRMEHGKLPLGDYVLVLRAYPVEVPHGQPSGFVAEISRPFIIRWKGMPRALKDLDLAIEQLQYIGKDSELEDFKSAKTLEEKQQKFIEFWKRRDPNPNTPRNEKMEEFYARVDYANKHFSHYREGWRTDMGLVYVILGPPSNVERHPFEIDSKPYEVWAYYDLNYQYVFVDQSGFGDYRLISPLWEVYNRRRE
jgi:GWxTD domain-containing protein